jgi:hypothetical protein
VTLVFLSLVTSNFLAAYSLLYAKKPLSMPHTWTPPHCQAFFCIVKSQEEIAAIHPALESGAKPRALMEYAGRRPINQMDF